jgi:D-alanyl-D-alanine carboxypeptidase
MQRVEAVAGNGEPYIYMRNVATKPYGRAFRTSLPALGRTGTLATVEYDSAAAGHGKSNTRKSSTPRRATQRRHPRRGLTDHRPVLSTANALGGYVDAKSGPFAITIFVSDVPVASLPAAHAVADDQGAIAAAIQQGY